MIEESLMNIWNDFLAEPGEQISGDTSDNTQEYYTTGKEESEDDKIWNT